MCCRARVIPLIAVALAALYCRGQAPAPAAAVAPPQPSQRSTASGIGCLGRVEPGDGVVRLAARGLTGQASIVGRLLVKEGDTVRTQQVIAELDSKSQLEAALHQAEARIEVARRRLEQAKAGAKPEEIAAQQADVDRWQFELENADREYRRYVSLGDDATASQVDAAKTRMDSTARALAQARHRLAGLGEVRGVDVALARAELQEAIQNAARARAEWEASRLRSPIDGRVIKIHAWPGAEVGDDGVLELAPTEPMYVVAEVSESDIGRVRVGQHAAISGEGLPHAVTGKVSRIGLKVLQNRIEPVDPASFSDGRVVDVWIEVDDAPGVADRIHMRVDVVIQPQ